MERQSHLPWYALHVRPRFEKIVARNLHAKGYEEFLPLQSTLRRWSDRTTVIQLPLFPGYLFCRFDLQYRLPIVMVPGVFSVVGVGGNVLPVAEHEIQSIRTIVKSRSKCERWQFPQPGEMVVVDEGAFEGVTGVVVAAGNRRRLIVSVEILQRSVAVEIDAHLVKRLRAAKTPLPALAARHAATVGQTDLRAFQ